MSSEYKEIQIENNKYRIGMLLASEQQSVLMFLAKIMGGFALKADAGEKSDNIKLALSGIGGLIEKLSLEQINDLRDKLFSQVSINKGENKYIPVSNVLESHFQGKMVEMYKLIFECLVYNFSDFMELLKKNPVLQNISEKVKHNLD